MNMITTLNVVIFLILLTFNLKIMLCAPQNRTAASSKPDRIRLACLIGKNTTIKLRHASLPGTTRVWAINDRLANESYDLAIVMNSDIESVSVWKTHDISLNGYYFYVTSSRGSTIIHRINIPQLESRHGAKEITFSQQFGYNRSEDLIFEIIALNKHSDCLTEHPLRRSKLTYDQTDISSFVKVRKGQSTRLYCSILVSIQNETNIPSQPVIKWFIEKPSRIDSLAFSSQNSSYYKLDSHISNESGSGGFNYIYWTEIEYTSPYDNLKAWRHHNEPVVCHIGHSSYFDGSATLVAEEAEFSYSIPRYALKIPALSCKLQLNVQFEPFVHPDVSLEQVFHESNVSALVECPIKANYHFPIRYFIIWSILWRENQTWAVKLQKEYVASADLFYIDKITYQDYDGARIKCELFEVDRYHFHPSDYKRHIYAFNRDEKKYTFLLESSVRIKVVPSSNRQHYAETTFECGNTCSESAAANYMPGLWILLNAFLSILGLYFLVQFVVSKIRKFKRRSVSFSPYHFEIATNKDNKNLDISRVDAAHLTLNPVSSLELLRKKSKFKSKNTSENDIMSEIQSTQMVQYSHVTGIEESGSESLKSDSSNEQQKT